MLTVNIYTVSLAQPGNSADRACDLDVMEWWSTTAAAVSRVSVLCSARAWRWTLTVGTITVPVSVV